MEKIGFCCIISWFSYIKKKKKDFDVFILENILKKQIKKIVQKAYKTLQIHMNVMRVFCILGPSMRRWSTDTIAISRLFDRESESISQY